MAENARAVVTVILEIQVGGGSWGAEATVGQIHKDALSAARHRVSEMCRVNPGVSTVGTMKVHMITHDLEDRK